MRTFSDLVWFGLACLVGLLVGFVAGVFHLSIDALSGLLASRVHAGSISVVWAALLVASITVFCAWLVKRFAPEAAGSGVQEIEGVMAGQRTLHWRRVLPVKFLGGVLSLSSGLVLGREGPTIHIGASVASGFADRFRLADLDRKGLLAAGAAAGLACAFNAPVAAMVFVVEEMRRHFPYSFRSFTAVGLACAMATVAADLIGGSAPDLSIAVSQQAVSLALLPWFMVLGVVTGGLGVLLNRSLLWVSTLGQCCHRRIPYLFQAVTGALVGVLLVVYPMAVTGGESLVREAGLAPLPLMTMLALVVVRFVMLVFSYATGVPGGIFAPILSIAMCAGLVFGVVMQWLLPHMVSDPVVFGLAAMGGLFTASVHAPVVGIILVAELTGAYSMLLPLMLTCLCALVTARGLGGQPVYEALLKRLLSS